MTKQAIIQRGFLGLMLVLLLSTAGGARTDAPRAEALGIGSPAVGYPEPQLIIGTDTTWTAAGSPYVITDSVYVSPSVTLTIEPGVEVRFDDYLGLVVSGTLIARGTASHPITFTTSRATPARGSWGYIKFTDTSVDATFDGSGNYVSGSILQYVTVQYAGSTGGALWLDNASPFIDNCTIRHNNRSGIYAYYSSGLRITNNTIANNTVPSSGGISTYTTTATISGNTITGNTAYTGGIYTLHSTVTISGNTITGNTATGGGGGIRAYGGTVTISGNTIANNTAYSGGGIYTQYGTVTISGNTIANNTAGTGGGIFASGTTTIAANTIANNTAGTGGGGIYTKGGTVTISANTIVNNVARNGGGIYANGTATISGNTIANNTASDAGGIFIYYGTVTISGTNFVGNSSYTVYNGSSQVITATNNWWGTTITAAIDAEIYDFSDDVSKGIVWYSPFLTAPNTEAPTSPPRGLAATPGAGSIALSWTANPEADIAGYKLYYDTDSGFPYASVITLGNTTVYTVTSLTASITYYLAVAAYDTSGDESWYSVEVSAVPLTVSPGAVVGWVDLQGRSNDSGALITLTGSVYTTTTAAAGAFTITGMAAGTYTATASRAGYLSAMRPGVVVTAGDTTMLPLVGLRGGNADRDNDIDIYDLTLLGANFGLAVPPGDSRADITGDGAINIFDLVLVGANYGLAAPRPW